MILLEAEVCGDGPERPQRGLRQRALVLAAGDPRAVRRRAGARARARRAGVGGRGRTLLRRAGGRRLVSARRVHARRDRSGVGRRFRGRDRGVPRPGDRAGVPDAERGGGPRPVRVAGLPWRSALPGGGDRAAGAARARPSRARPGGGRAGVRADAGGRGRAARRRRGGPLRARRGHGRRGGAGERRGPGRGSRPAQAADADLEPHGDHRARSRAARGDRLDGGRVHHRRAGDGPLLPHHSRRADRLRLGRRRGRPRARGSAGAPRSTRASSPRSSGTCCASSRGSRAGGSSARGAVRSTSRRATCRWSSSWTAASTRASATPATASAPRRWSARSLASLALGRRDESHPARLSSSPPPVHVPPEPFRYAGGAIVRRAILRKEAALERDARPGPVTRLVAAIPERIGIHVGR